MATKSLILEYFLAVILLFGIASCGESSDLETSSETTITASSLDTELPPTSARPLPPATEAPPLPTTASTASVSSEDFPSVGEQIRTRISSPATDFTDEYLETTSELFCTFASEALAEHDRIEFAVSSWRIQLDEAYGERKWYETFKDDSTWGPGYLEWAVASLEVYCRFSAAPIIEAELRDL